MPIFKSKNEHFFKTWSSEMAYVLGFFTADGSMYITKRGACYFQIANSDKEILEKIRKALNSNHAITAKNRNSKWRTEYELQIGSKIMFNDLLALGLMPRKSKCIVLPAVPRDYFADFVRGYFDGDGHVSMGTYRRSDRESPSRIITSGFTSGSRVFLEQLSVRLREDCGLRGGTFLYGSQAYRLSFSIGDSRTLYDVMYTTMQGDLFLYRKRQAFEKYFNIA